MSCYFDNAATTFPKPECVYSAMDSFYRAHGGNAGRGRYGLAAEASRVAAETRTLLQQLLRCTNKDVLFAPSATIALNMVIQGVIASGKIRTVYISPFEHNSVTRVLHHFEKNGSIRIGQLSVSKEFVFDFQKIGEQFAKVSPDLVVVSHASNVVGLIAPVLQIFAEAKKFGAVTVTDMAQTAGTVPLEVGNDLIDFAIFAGHKTLYGPFGIGGFVKRQGAKLEPVLFGGTGIDSANQDMPEDIPSRYEMGSQNACAIAGLHAALEWSLQNLGEIRAKENANHAKLLSLLRKFDFVKIVGPESRKNCIGVVSALFDGYSAEEIGSVLNERQIAVRPGLQCSPIAHKFLGTFPAGTVRFSVGYFTGKSELAELEHVLEWIGKNR